LLGNYKYLDINIPYYDYIRASIFVQDLRDNFGEEVPLQFNEAVLIWILNDDFLKSNQERYEKREHVWIYYHSRSEFHHRNQRVWLYRHKREG
jgi:hypothetical protein